MGILLPATGFVSDIDKVLKNFDQTYPTLSAAQHTEINKHARLAALRDHAETIEEGKTLPIWEKF